ncbi:MAG TPA: cyclic nucleotide-binding domain-containing protein [Ilumatobacteraceae bacterium]|jgi:CRP-like cAMP-binding protein
MARRLRYPYTLTRFDLFAECTRPQLRLIASLFTTVRVPEGTVVMREGTFGREFLIVADGQAEVSQGSEADTRLMNVVGNGAVLGEMALLNRAPRAATITTISSTVVLACNAGEFGALMEVAPSAATKIRHIAATRMEQNLAA